MGQTIVRIAKSISGPIGALLMAMGGIWILQGLNLAWGPLARSFMQNDRHWAVYGSGSGVCWHGFDRVGLFEAGQTVGIAQEAAGSCRKIDV